MKKALISSGISCSRGSGNSLLLDVPAGVYPVTNSDDESTLTLSARLPLTGYLKGERPLQELFYYVGKTVPGVRWVVTSNDVHLVVDRLVDSTPEDDSRWVIGASSLLDQAISELDMLARRPKHNLWHFANLRSVAP